MKDRLLNLSENSPKKAEHFTIRPLLQHEKLPMDLLLLADPSQQAIEKYIYESTVHVALENERIIGVYALLKVARQKVELMNVAVDEAYQGKGIGKALVLHAIEFAKLHSMQAITVGTGNSSIEQLAFYQKCGFRMKEIVHNYFTDNYKEPIFENGIQCRDMVRLEMSFHD